MIDKINANPIGVRSSLKPANQVSFRGGYTEAITDGLKQANAIRKMKSMKRFEGEIGGILITALGTGLVAPIFIGFNPFVRAPKGASEEEKQEVRNTKQYTAMRQPISAVLAMLFQASVQKYIDQGLDKVFNDKERAKKVSIYKDQQDLLTDTRVEAMVKEEMKNEKKPSFIKGLFSQEARAQRKAYSEKFEARVDAIKEERINKIAGKFQDTGYIWAGQRKLDDKTTADLLKKQINEYIDDAKKLKKSPERIAFYEERAKVLAENEAFFREKFAPIKDLIAAKDPKANSEATKLVNELLKDEKVNSDVKQVLQEILDRSEDLRAHRIGRTLERIDTINAACGGKYDAKKYRKALNHRNTILDDVITDLTKTTKKLETGKLDNKFIQGIIDEVSKICNINNRGKDAKNILENTDTFGTEGKDILKKIYKDVTKKYKDLVKNHYKSWNQIVKIGVGVFITLPITCTALNWVYPRFMEIFFPKLAGVKKDTVQKEQQAGGDK